MRSAGVLLPVTALSGGHGIGTLGAAARQFLDFLQAGGQRVWQMLPLGPTGFGDSPYQCFSSFAGNPYLIDLDDLCRDGLLKREEYAPLDWGRDPGRVDYGLLYRQRFAVLAPATRRARERFPQEYAAYCKAQAAWLPDYALFMALKDYQNGVSWDRWPEPLRRRAPDALRRARGLLAPQIAFWQEVQFLFARQWSALRREAADRGIRLIGDLPIYTAYDSADVWAAPDLFQLGSDLHPTSVAGCPPDAFSPTGQLWGNPLYDWPHMARDHYTWWQRRLAHQFAWFDEVRLDHFRGFSAYYAIPAGDRDATGGTWQPGPGLAFFDAMRRALGPLPLIAEDLGLLTPDVYDLLEATGFPGMKILQFAFDDEAFQSDYLPHRYDRRCVVYTGTHDNDTTCGWLRTAPPETRARAAAYLRLHDPDGPVWGMLRSAWASVADLAIAPLQDLLALDSDARMNTPATLGGNWTWRCPAGALTPTLAARLRREMKIYGRLA